MGPIADLFRRTLVGAAALAAVVASSRAALAQDYTATPLAGLYEAPPVGAVAAGSSSASTARVDLPFEFAYFGVLYDHFSATNHGYVQFGNDTGTIDPGGGNFGSLSSGQPADGACAAVWGTLATGTLANAKVWTAGTAPSRRVIISYEDVRPASGAAVLTFQMKFFETTGRIEFAFRPDSVPTTWTGFSYKQGMDAPATNDPRYSVPYSSSVQTAYPPSDIRIVPTTVNISGRLLFERLNGTAAGWGGPSTIDPLRGVTLDVLYADGRRAGRGSTNANGDLVLPLFSGPPSLTVDVYALLDGPVCSVKSSPAAATLARKVFTGVRYDTSKDVGTVTIDATADAAATFRGPAAIYSAIDRARAWIAARSATPIPKANVGFDPASASVTAYLNASSNPAFWVAGPGAANDDRWDDAVVIRTYGRHVAAGLAAVSTTAFNDAFDAVSDDQNAFALGFGYFLAAATLNKNVWLDATSASTGVSVALENYAPSTRKGPDVGAWVTLALFDLLDPANESFDPVDGSNAGVDRVVQVLDALTTPPTAATFLDAWSLAGLDARGISKIFVAHGLVADDALEPNDDATELPSLGSLPLRRDALVLNVGNEDWFAFTLPAAVSDVVADMNFARTTYTASIELQVFSGAGSSLVDVVDSGTNAVTANLGSLAAGTYRLRVRHLSGKRVPAYTVEVFRRVVMDHTPLPSWTRGIPYERTVSLAGGVGTLTFLIQNGSIPPGLTPEAANQRIVGTPTQKGTFDFTLTASDAGFPAHTDSAPQHLVINDPLTIDLGGFVAFALGKPVDLVRAHAGGTSPLVVTMPTGDLPQGLALAADDLRFSGTPTVAGSTVFTVSATDVAGSQDGDEAVAVVCVPFAGPKTPAALAAAKSGCGFFVDAVIGSSVKVSIGTAPKSPKRVLRAALLGPDGAPVDGAIVKGGTGKASISLAAVPATGRYFAVVASDAGDATGLVGTSSVTPSKKGKGGFDDLAGGAFFDVKFGALAGARLSFKAQAAKNAGLTVTYAALLDPDGNGIPLTGLTSVKGATALLSGVLPKSGTWTVRVRGNGTGPADVSYSYSIAQPKGVTYSQD